MKKILIALTICTFGFTALARTYVEEEENRTVAENEYLPVWGDVAIGLDGTPFFDYLGNMFNGTLNNSLNLGQSTLHFRYFIAGNSALRARIRIAADYNAETFYVTDDAAFMTDPLSRKEVIDRRINSDHLYFFSAGYQWFKSFNRLRGFLGGDAGYTWISGKEIFEYGNVMNELNPSPTTNWGNLANRPVETLHSQNQVISAGIFTGAEYFFMPKVCIGGEFGLNYGLTLRGQRWERNETMAGSQLVEEEIALTPRRSRMTAETSFPSAYGNLYFMVHF